MNTKLKASLFFTAIFLASSLSSWALPSNLSYGFAMDKQNSLFEWNELNTSTENIKFVNTKQWSLGRNIFGHDLKNISLGVQSKQYFDNAMAGAYYGLGFVSHLIYVPKDNTDFFSEIAGGNIMLSIVPAIGYDLLVSKLINIGVSTEFDIGFIQMSPNAYGYFYDVRFDLRTTALLRFKVGLNDLHF